MGHGHDEATRWDEFYAGDGDDAPHWSGEPNPTLVAEVTATSAVGALRPGRALDVGCGEGGDAIWLARHGWQATGIDPSDVALDRARAAARAAGVEVTWVRAGLLDLPEDHGTYDLVSAHYPVLPLGDGDAAVAALLAAVAPGCTLLVVHHELDPVHAAEHGSDLGVHVTPEVVAVHLGDGWTVEVAETRDRGGRRATDEHPRDIVLRARRR
jgi:SAM-dependent methyltransferase